MVEVVAEDVNDQSVELQSAGDFSEVAEEDRNLDAKWYLNGFPKSGLHLAVQMVRPLLRLQKRAQMRARPWVGTFDKNSWSDSWLDMRQMLYHLSNVRPGHYIKGHCAWQPGLEEFMYWCGFAHVFIYRDLRDVAVSQAHHIMSDSEHLLHPGKERYRALGTFDDVLEAVIVGLDEYPGVLARWETYAPWLNVDWVYKFRFEDAVQSPSRVAEELIGYGLERIGIIFGLEPRTEGENLAQVVDAMVESTRRTEQSPTFRAGRIGNWRGTFDGRHKQLFKEMDSDNWLVRLGYEKDQSW